MEIKFEKVTDLSEIDFDIMFEDSFERMNRNFLWSSNLLTTEDKKQFYKSQLEDAFRGKSHLQRDGERLFAFKILVDGQIGLFNCGFIETDEITIRFHWYLVSPVNGSRMFIYSDEAAIARTQFYADNGIAQYKAPTHTAAALYNGLKKNDVRKIISIVDEIDGPDFRGVNLATLTVKV